MAFSPWRGGLIGDIQLANIDWRQRTATLGLGIARQGDRAQGYGADATRTLVQFAFEHLDLYRISVGTMEFNLAAQRALEKCGFVREGRERQAYYCAGRRWDRLNYGLLRGELESPREEDIENERD